MKSGKPKIKSFDELVESNFEDVRSRTDINNFVSPYYRVLLEDGPSHSECGGYYGSSVSQLYFSPRQMATFYSTLPFLARYYKITISIVENPNPTPF